MASQLENLRRERHSTATIEPHAPPRFAGITLEDSHAAKDSGRGKKTQALFWYKSVSCVSFTLEPLDAPRLPRDFHPSFLSSPISIPYNGVTQKFPAKFKGMCSHIALKLLCLP